MNAKRTLITVAAVLVLLTVSAGPLWAQPADKPAGKPADKPTGPADKPARQKHRPEMSCRCRSDR